MLSVSMVSRVLLSEKAGGEWVQLFVSDVFTLYRERQQLGPLLKELNSDPELKKIRSAAIGYANAEYEVRNGKPKQKRKRRHANKQ